LCYNATISGKNIRPKIISSIQRYFRRNVLQLTPAPHKRPQKSSSYVISKYCIVNPPFPNHHPSRLNSVIRWHCHNQTYGIHNAWLREVRDPIICQRRFAHIGFPFVRDDGRYSLSDGFCFVLAEFPISLRRQLVSYTIALHKILLHP
jgi:hypothetical protein